MNIINRLSFGILGGMGPYATVLFYKLILDNLKVEKDWEYPHLVIDSANYIPSRSRYILYNEDSPVDEMEKACIKLELYPVDIIVIPCNSASIFIEEIQPNIKIPILNIIELTVNELEKGKLRCVVLGGRVTYFKESYKKFLNKNDHIFVQHSENIQISIEKLIENIKLQKLDSVEDDFFEVYDSLKKSLEFDCIILGCTELTILSGLNLDCILMDSSTSLAKEIIRLSQISGEI